MLRQAGVGLVEVMIALLLSLLTVGIIIQVLLGNHKTYLTGEAKSAPRRRPKLCRRAKPCARRAE